MQVGGHYLEHPTGSCTQAGVHLIEGVCMLKLYGFHCVGGMHCCHVGVQNKRKFVHVVCIKIKVNSQR